MKESFLLPPLTSLCCKGMHPINNKHAMQVMMYFIFLT